MRRTSTSSASTRYATTYGVLGTTSSRVPRTRPGRPRCGKSANVSTALTTRAAIISPAAGASVAIYARSCSRSSSAGGIQTSFIRALEARGQCPSVRPKQLPEHAGFEGRPRRLLRRPRGSPRFGTPAGLDRWPALHSRAQSCSVLYCRQRSHTRGVSATPCAASASPSPARSLPPSACVTAGYLISARSFCITCARSFSTKSQP
jgi:hypothetical protein